MNKTPSGLEKFTLSFTKWVGSIPSLIVHTIVFIVSFALVFLGVALETVLLILTTAVSLEAIYLAIFIQMSVNRQAESLQEVEDDIDEIQEDIDEIQEDVEDIEEDMDEIQLNNIYADLKKLVDDVEKFKHQNNNK